MHKDKKKDGTTVITSGHTIQEILDVVYPIGAIYMSIDSANPAAIFGGTWSAWGTGRVPVGYDVSQTEFDTVEETGGAKTHVHDLDSSTSGARIRISSDNSVWALTKTLTSRAMTRMVGVSSNAPQTDESVSAVALEGDSNASSSLQPYIVCYMWKRTA